MPSLFGRRRRGSAPEAADPVEPGSSDRPVEDSDSGVVTPDGSLQWVGSDGVVVGGAEPDVGAKPATPAAPATEGLWEVIRPAAIVPEEAARQVLVELARRDLSNGGEWQSEPQLWSRYDAPVEESERPEPELMGQIHVTYGTPTKYEITLYRVTVTAAGVDEGWTVASLTDEALGFGGLTLAQCPRATMSTPPQPFTY